MDANTDNKTIFIVTLQQALTNALARFTTDKSVNKSLIAYIQYTVKNNGADVQIRFGRRCFF